MEKVNVEEKFDICSFVQEFRRVSKPLDGANGDSFATTADANGVIRLSISIRLCGKRSSIFQSIRYTSAKPTRLG